MTETDYDRGRADTIREFVRRKCRYCAIGVRVHRGRFRGVARRLPVLPGGLGREPSRPGLRQVRRDHTHRILQPLRTRLRLPRGRRRKGQP